MKAPKHSTGQELTSDDYKIWLECDTCGISWSLDLSPGVKLPEDYWLCPNGCNVPKETIH